VYFDRNENRYGPAPACMQELRQADGELLFSYSRSFQHGYYSELSARLSALHGIDEKRIILGYGCEDILKEAVHHFLPSGHAVLIPSASWWYYHSIAAEVGGVTVEYPLRPANERYEYDVDALIRLRETADPSLVLLASPNNPTGNSLRREDLRRLLDRSTRWLLNYRPQPLAVGAEINRFAAKVAELAPGMPGWLRGDDQLIVAKESGEFAIHGVPKDLAYVVASGLYRYSLLDVIDIADIVDRDPGEVADTYFALMDYLGTDGLLTAVSGLPRDDRWHALARLAVRDDIYGSLRALCFDVLAVGEPGETGEQKIAEWEQGNGSRVSRARRTLAEIRAHDAADLATLSVAARQIRSMTRTSGTGTSG
jgi:hypothetical protein